MKSRALDVARKAGINGEQAIATHEGTAAETGVFAEWADLSVPGADLLRGKSRRIVLVTDQTVRVFDGRRFGKVGEQLGAYRVSDDLLAYDDQRLIFPDDQSVVLNEHQAREIVAATGGVLNYARANYALRRLGVHDEAGLGSATGDVPGSAHRTAGDVIGDIALGGPLDSKTTEKRLLLFSDKNVRLFHARALHELGQPLGVYAVGTQLVLDDRTVTFPDGAAVVFKTSKVADRVADVVARGKSAVE